MNKIVYITGCLGFIGSYFTRTCLKLGWHVRGIDKITYAASINFLNEFKQYSNFSFEHKDINDLDRLIDCDIFFNFAASSHVDNSIINSDEFIKSNINGVYNILQLLKSYKSNGYKLPLFVQISTDEVFGDILTGSHNETDVLKPSNPYSATKASADMLVLGWYRTFNIPYIIARPTNNYGIGQYPEKLIPKSCKYIKLGKKIPLHNNGTPTRVWLHAQDTSDAILTIVNSNVKNEIYNISGNIELSNIDVVKKIVKIMKNEDSPIPYCDFSYSRDGQDLRYSLNDNKLKKLGWKPIKKFDDEIKNIIEYYNDNFIW